MEIKNTIAVQVPTAALKDMLNTDPEVMLSLQRTACEKIAEEIHRKALKMTDTQIESRIREISTQAYAKLARKHTFPQETKLLIMGIAEDAVKTYMARTQTELKNSVNRMITSAQVEMDAKMQKQFTDGIALFQAAIDKSYAEQVAALEATIQQQARAEFVSVLQEVKSA